MELLKPNDDKNVHVPFATTGLNTIMLAVTLGGLGWIAHVSWNNSTELARLSGGQITRSELDQKVESLRRDMTSLEKAITVLQTKIDNQPRH